MITYVLEVTRGPNKGRVFSDLRPPFLIGRDVDEPDTVRPAVALTDDLVSRKHAIVSVVDGNLELTDVSRNGTIVYRERSWKGRHPRQEKKIELQGQTKQCRLRVGDLVGVGRTVLRVGLRQASIDGLQGTDTGGRFEVVRAGDRSLSDECRRIRGLLETNHVFWDRAEEVGLLEAVERSDSPQRTIFGHGFHRFVLIDAAAGQPDSTGFDAAAFLTTAAQAAATAFGLSVYNSSFHAEDVFQMLKDEPRSLFCVIHFDRVPTAHLHLIRGFTQGVHRVLLLCAGVRAVATEEWDQDDAGSVVSDAVVRRSASGAATQLGIKIADYHRSSELPER